jgi:hypothetical protein
MILQVITKFTMFGVLIGLHKIIIYYHIQLEIHWPVLIVCCKGVDHETDHFACVLNIGRECQIIGDFCVWGGDDVEKLMDKWIVERYDEDGKLLFDLSQPTVPPVVCTGAECH